MKKAFILFCFGLFYLGSIAQTSKSDNATPITKEAVSKFKTINEVLGIPASYEVLKYSIMYVDSHAVSYPATTLDIPSMFAYTHAGTKIIFTDIQLKKGDRQIKLADKVYIMK